MKHDLYQTGDRDAPDVIRDRNGHVVLGLCKRCGKAEVELSGPCLKLWICDQDGFEGVQIGSYTTLQGKEGIVLQQVGTRVVHVYGRARVRCD